MEKGEQAVSEDKCSYFGCDSDVADFDPNIRGFQFCGEHDLQFAAIVKSDKPPREIAKQMLSFWVKAQGGAQRAASRAMGEVGENNP